MGQAVRVLLHHADGVIAVGLVDADGTGGPHAVTLKKDHDLPHHPLIMPTRRDPFFSGGTDTGHFGETGGAALDDLKDVLSERLDELLGEVRADALDET